MATQCRSASLACPPRSHTVPMPERGGDEYARKTERYCQKPAHDHERLTAPVSRFGAAALAGTTCAPPGMTDDGAAITPGLCLRMRLRCRRVQHSLSDRAHVEVRSSKSSARGSDSALPSLPAQPAEDPAPRGWPARRHGVAGHEHLEEPRGLRARVLPPASGHGRSRRGMAIEVTAFVKPPAAVTTRVLTPPDARVSLGGVLAANAHDVEPSDRQALQARGRGRRGHQTSPASPTLEHDDELSSPSFCHCLSPARGSLRPSGAPRRRRSAPSGSGRACRRAACT